MERARSNKNIYISNRLWDQFQVISNLKKESMSQVLENFIEDYIIKNKAEANAAIKNFWGIDDEKIIETDENKDK